MLKKITRTNKLSQLYRNLTSKIIVYALVGASGTGKSFRARLVAERNEIDSILDDGLLIRNGAIVAGRSAKKEAVYIKAIKTAIFDSDQHLFEVKDYIRTEKLPKLLIIGTSKKMINIICDRLRLPEVKEWILIDDISTKDEIEKALSSRKEGKHVIPVPALELKRDYSSIFAHSVRVFFSDFAIFRNRGDARNKHKKDKSFESTIVKPPFHSANRGKVTISELALTQMVEHCIDEFNHEIQIIKIKLIEHRGNYKIKLNIAMPFKQEVNNNMHKLQAYIITHIERYSSIIIEEVSLDLSIIK